MFADIRVFSRTEKFCLFSILNRLQLIMSNIKYLTVPEAVSMEDEWFEIANLEHFWVQWRYAFFKSFLDETELEGKKIFEVGCGHGLMINQIEAAHNSIVDGCDLNEYALKKISNNKGELFCYNIYQKNEAFKNHYDGLILFDVVEHIDDDVDFLRTAMFHLKSEGWVAVNVPAYQAFYSRYDTVLGHKRRYTKKMLRERMEAIGLTDIRVAYWGFSMLPALIVRKLLLAVKGTDVAKYGFKPPSESINSLFKSMMKAELKLMKKPLAGASVMAFGRKV